MNELQLVSVRVNLGEYMQQLFENLKVMDLYVSLLNFPSLLTTKVTFNIHYCCLFLALFKGTLRITNAFYMVWNRNMILKDELEEM